MTAIYYVMGSDSETSSSPCIAVLHGVEDPSLSLMMTKEEKVRWRKYCAAACAWITCAFHADSDWKTQPPPQKILILLIAFTF